MNNVVFHLQRAGDSQEAYGFGEHRVALKYALPDHDVNETGFILQGHKDHAAGRAGALAADHQPRIIDFPAVGHLRNGTRVR